MKTITSMICLLLILTPISAQTDLSFGQIWKRVGDDPLFYNIGENSTDWNGRDVLTIFVGGHLLEDGDTLRFYMAGWNGTNYSIGMWYSTHLDSGWQEYPGNPVMTPTPGTWDSPYMGAPHVIKDGDTYKMWYIGTPGDDDLNRLFVSIGYATSPDGIHWTKHPEPVIRTGADIDPNFRFAQSPFVLKDGDGWFLLC